MSISFIGKGLSILVTCDFVIHHDWMSFLTFWSMKKNLPDATMSIVCRRSINSDIFGWARKCSVPLVFYNYHDVEGAKNYMLGNPRSKLLDPVLVVPPNLLFVRDFEEAGFDTKVFENNFDALKIDGFISDAKSQNTTVCCDYSKGWGNFVANEWINKESMPLIGVNFSAGIMSPNERRIAALWESATNMYQSLSRG